MKAFAQVFVLCPECGKFSFLSHHSAQPFLQMETLHLGILFRRGKRSSLRIVPSKRLSSDWTRCGDDGTRMSVISTLRRGKGITSSGPVRATQLGLVSKPRKEDNIKNITCCYSAPYLWSPLPSKVALEGYLYPICVQISTCIARELHYCFPGMFLVL